MVFYTCMVEKHDHWHVPKSEKKKFDKWKGTTKMSRSMWTIMRKKQENWPGIAKSIWWLTCFHWQVGCVTGICCACFLIRCFVVSSFWCWDLCKKPKSFQFVTRTSVLVSVVACSCRSGQGCRYWCPGSPHLEPNILHGKFQKRNLMFVFIE